MLIPNNLATIDFNRRYKEQRAATDFRPKNRQDWDAKAPEMNQRVLSSGYNRQFLAKAERTGCKSLLDVGCGVGNLSLALAPEMERVTAIDFSPEMLRLGEENARNAGIVHIDFRQKAWEESWDDLPVADLVIASRSMEVNDMREALEKLDSQAAKQVYVTYKVGGTFLDKEVMDVLERTIVPKPDHFYLLGVLNDMGVAPTVVYIESESRENQFTGKEGFLKNVGWSIGTLSETEKEELGKFYDRRRGDLDRVFKPNRWALIGWSKE